MAETFMINQLMIKSNNMIKLEREGDDYTPGCLLDYQYFKDNYQLTTVNSSLQKELDADPRAVQQLEFYCMLNTNSKVCTVLEISKETKLEFYNGTTKVL